MSGIQQDFRGANNYRPNIIGDGRGALSDQRTVQNWFNRAAVVGSDRSKPAVRQRAAQCLSWPDSSGKWTSPRRSVSVCRGDTSNFEFRAEFFNLFNRTNFRAPTGNSVNASNAAFGTITATYDPRIIQFGLKLEFLRRRRSFQLPVYQFKVKQASSAKSGELVPVNWQLVTGN